MDNSLNVVTFKQAKRLKKLGYVSGSQSSYIRHKKTYVYDNDPSHSESYKKGDIHFSYDWYYINSKNYDSSYWEAYEAPLFQEALDWIRDTYDIWMYAAWDFNSKSWYYCIQFLTSDSVSIQQHNFPSQFDAISAAFDRTLKHLKNTN
jgi:hypothetical protein